VLRAHHSLDELDKRRNHAAAFAVAVAECDVEHRQRSEIVTASFQIAQAEFDILHGIIVGHNVGGAAQRLRTRCTRPVRDRLL
jgi:hypothetical protein